MLIVNSILNVLKWMYESTCLKHFLFDEFTKTKISAHTVVRLRKPLQLTERNHAFLVLRNILKMLNVIWWMGLLVMIYSSASSRIFFYNKQFLTVDTLKRNIFSFIQKTSSETFIFDSESTHYTEITTTTTKKRKR